MFNVSGDGINPPFVDDENRPLFSNSSVVFLWIWATPFKRLKGTITHPSPLPPPPAPTRLLAPRPAATVRFSRRRCRRHRSRAGGAGARPRETTDTSAMEIS